jgi:hypothetical protein
VIANIQEMKVEEYHYLESIPIVVYSYEKKDLDSEIDKLTGFEYIESAEVTSSKSITDSLVKKYDLRDVKKVIKKYSLPNIMYLYIIGEKFDASAKNELIEYLNNNEKGFALDYNDEIWLESNRRLKLFDTAINSILITFYLIIFLVAAFIRNYVERSNEKYWKVYQHAGGDKNLRKQTFMRHSLMLVLLPSGFNFIAILLFLNNFSRYGLTNILLPMIVLGIAQVIVFLRLNIIYGKGNF